MSQPRTLYIVDRDSGLARSLATLLSSHDLRVEIRSNGEELLANLDLSRAACVLVEKQAPGMSVDEIRTRLRLLGVAIPVIVIDARTAAEWTAGPAQASGSELLEQVLKGERLVGLALAAPNGTAGRPGRAAKAVPETFPTLATLRVRFERLTAREREIAQLVAQGYSSKNLARKLNLSKSTVDNHRARILEKLQLENSVQMTRSLAMLLAKP